MELFQLLKRMFTMKNKTCCFTGHRVISAEDYPEIQKSLEIELRKLVNQGVRYFGAGGALGFDTMAALTVLKLRHEYPAIKLILVLPCREQAARWTDEDKKTYDYILKQADKTVYTSERYFNGCMQKRNRHLINSSGVCICYLTKDKGGAAYTVEYAQQKEVRIINLAALNYSNLRSTS